MLTCVAIFRQLQTMKMDSKKLRQRWDRAALSFDRAMALGDRLGLSAWRRALWQGVNGGKVVEVGMGTGRNFPFYPRGASITGIDMSQVVLTIARERAKRLGVEVNLLCMDVQQMSFPDDIFDTVIGSFVFCEVPDPMLGLKEVRRVLQPSGRLILLEHVRSRGLLGKGMNILNPLVTRLCYGENINRRTVDNIEKAGFKVLNVKKVLLDVVVLVEATPTKV